MIRVNLMPNAVSIALRFSRELELVDKRCRDSIVSILWFHYVGIDYE